METREYTVPGMHSGDEQAAEEKTTELLETVQRFMKTR